MSAPRITDLLLDDNDELVIVNGDWAFAADEVGIKQGIRIRLRFFQGEWIFDLAIGISYWQDIFVKNPSLIIVREIFRRALAAAPGVQEVLFVTVVYTSESPRTVKVTWQVRGDVGLLKGSIERSAT